MLQKLKTIFLLVVVIFALGVGFWGGSAVEKGKTAEQVAQADAQARAEMEAASLAQASALEAKTNVYLDALAAVISDPEAGLAEEGRAALLASLEAALQGDPEAAQALLPAASTLKMVAAAAGCDPAGQVLKMHPGESADLCDGEHVLKLIAMSDGVAQQVRLTVNDAEAHLEPGQRVGFGNGCFAVLQGLMIEDARQHAEIRIECSQ